MRMQSAASRAGHRIRRWGGRGGGDGRPDEWGAAEDEHADYGDSDGDWQANQGAGGEQIYDRYGGDHVDGDWRAGPEAEEGASGDGADAQASSPEETADASAAPEAQTAEAAPTSSSFDDTAAVSNAVPPIVATAADLPICSGEASTCALSAWLYQVGRRPLTYPASPPLWPQEPAVIADPLSAQYLARQQRQSRLRLSRRPRLGSQSAHKHPHLCLRQARVRRQECSQYHRDRRPRLKGRPQRL